MFFFQGKIQRLHFFMPFKLIQFLILFRNVVGLLQQMPFRILFFFINHEKMCFHIPKVSFYGHEHYAILTFKKCCFVLPLSDIVFIVVCLLCFRCPTSLFCSILHVLLLSCLEFFSNLSLCCLFHQRWFCRA